MKNHKKEGFLIGILTLSILLINFISIYNLYNEKKLIMDIEYKNHLSEQSIIIDIGFESTKDLTQILIPFKHKTSSNGKIAVVQKNDTALEILSSQQDENVMTMIKNYKKIDFQETDSIIFLEYLNIENQKIKLYYTYLAKPNCFVIYEIKDVNLLVPYIKVFVKTSIIAIFILLVAAFLIFKIVAIFNKNMAETHARFLNIVKNADAAYFFIAPDGIIKEINKAYVKLHKYESEKEIIGLHLTNIRTDLTNETVNDLITNVIARKPTYLNGECPYFSKDGSVGYSSFSVRPVVSGGKTIGIEGFLIDITPMKLNEIRLQKNETNLKNQNEEYESINEELKQANLQLTNAKEEIEKSERRLRNYLQNAPDGIFVCDRQGNYTAVNPAACLLTGYQETELLKMSIRDLLDPSNLNTGAEHFANLLKNGKSLGTIKFIRKNKTEYYMEIAAVKIKENEFIGFCKDVTIQVNNAKILQQKNNEIEAQNEEYKQINEELLIAKQKAEESVRLKTSFLQNISHEVRTPMNSILGFSQLLTRPNLSQEKILSFNEKISTSCENLLNIITDIIEISQLETSVVNVAKEEFNVIELLNDSIDLIKNRHKAKSLDFIFSINTNLKELYIKNDKYKISKILFHLLDNAAKFTHTGSVKLDCNISDNYLIIKVIDTGIGINETEQNIIFEPFRQVELGTTRKYGGNGVGLSIVKKYVDILDGTLSLLSKPDTGSTFAIQIPNHSKCKFVVNKSIPLKKMNLKNHVILIVEDEEINFQYLKVLLEDTEATVIRAVNGQQAVDICESAEKINIILMDIKMPILDGYEATKIIKRLRPNLPIIAQTAYALENERTQFLTSGFNDYITKPIYEENFFKILTKYI